MSGVKSRPRGLGKGLQELLSATLGVTAATDVLAAAMPETSTPAESLQVKEPQVSEKISGSTANTSLVELAVDLIKPGPFQPRNTIHQEGLEQLSESIKQQGVIQPIVVRLRADGLYEILAGERRWRASQLAGLSHIPAVIRKVPDEVAMAISLIENIQRENLNPVEEAKALKRLADVLQLTHLQVAEMLGKSRASITNLLRLLSLNPDVQLLLEKGELDMGHARALLGLRGVLQSQMAKTVLKRALSVRETERIVARLQEGGDRERARRVVDPDIRRLEQDLADKLGAAVSIRHTPRGMGTLQIRYNNTEELDGILSHIMVSQSTES